MPEVGPSLIELPVLERPIGTGSSQTVYGRKMIDECYIQNVPTERHRQRPYCVKSLHHILALSWTL